MSEKSEWGSGNRSRSVGQSVPAETSNCLGGVTPIASPEIAGANHNFLQIGSLEQGAIFDPTGAYRYSLWRRWSAAPRIAFVMLNPSTADAQTLDPTIRRCLHFAQAWGYGSLEVVNLFAFKATHPTLLKQAIDPIGADCDRYLLSAVASADRAVLAWGNWGKLHGRDRVVLSQLAQQKLHCLGITQSGQPRHPLYLRATTSLVEFSVSIQS